VKQPSCLGLSVIRGDQQGGSSRHKRSAERCPPSSGVSLEGIGCHDPLARCGQPHRRSSVVRKRRMRGRIVCRPRIRHRCCAPMRQALRSHRLCAKGAAIARRTERKACTKHPTKHREPHGTYPYPKLWQVHLHRQGLADSAPDSCTVCTACKHGSGIEPKRTRSGAWTRFAEFLTP
jgi:hypothetical protein